MSDEPSADQRIDILCVDKSAKTRTLLQKAFKANGLSAEIAGNLGDGLSQIVKFNPKLLIIDVDMPDTNPIEALRALRKQSFGLVIIILSKQEVIENLKPQELPPTFEIIAKPIKASTLVTFARRGLRFYHQNIAKHLLANENMEMLKRHLEYLLWRDNINEKNRFFFYRMIVENIRHSVSQGMGIGSMVSMMELLEMGAHWGDEMTQVETNTFRSVLETNEAISDWLSNLEYIRDYFHFDYDIEKLQGETLVGLVDETIEKVRHLSEIKGQEIVYQAPELGNPAYNNTKLLKFSISELLTNAFKFSPEKSKVRVQLSETDEAVTFVVENEAIPMRGANEGIPEEFENQVFEPFFRMNHTFDERFRDAGPGLGLGLTIIKGAFNRVFGNVYLYQVVQPGEEGGAAKTRIYSELVLTKKDPSTMSERRFQFGD